jgi:hypothetical protein
VGKRRGKEVVEPRVSVEEAIARMDSDGHGRFRDICTVYGDGYRDVFREAFRNSFIRNANKAELAFLRKAIQERSGRIAHLGERGRPRNQNDRTWLANTKIAVWQHIVDCLTWRQIAKSRGMYPTKTNIRTIQRTLKRQIDQYALMIWQACIEAGVWQPGADPPEQLALIEKKLEVPLFRELLWVRVGLPFARLPGNDLTEGCRKIVLALALRGEHASGRELIEVLKRRNAARLKGKPKSRRQ